MKLEQLVHFARTHNVRAIAKGITPARHTRYFLIVDAYTQPFREELERFEHEVPAPELQILPFRDYFMYAYRNSTTEIWREAKLSPANIEEELVSFAKHHPSIKALRKGVHDEEGFESWYFMVNDANKNIFDDKGQLANLTRDFACRGTNVDACYWTMTCEQPFLGTEIWKRKKTA